MLETVGRGFLMAIRCLLTFLAEQKHFMIKEEMSLHGFEARQVLHFTVTFLMVCPNIKRPLHEEFSQIIQIALKSHTRLTLAQTQKQKIDLYIYRICLTCKLL